MRLNSQPSHIVSFLPGITTCVRWGRGDSVRESPRRHRRDTSTGSTTPRPHVPVQQVRRPVGLAPRPRHEADGVVLAPAAPFLAEAALGDAGHFFRGVRAGSPRSSRRCICSRCFGQRSASAAVVAQLACCCFAGHSGSGADSARKFERAQYGRCGGTNLRLRNLDRSAVRRCWQS